MTETAPRRTLADLIEQHAPGVTVVRPRRATAQGYAHTSRDTAAGPLSGFVYPRHYAPTTPGRTRFHVDAGVVRLRFLVACCGRRGGKTQAGAAEFVDRIIEDVENKTLGRGYWQGDPHDPWVRGEGKDPEAFLRYFVVAPTSALLDEPSIALQRMLGHARSRRDPGLIIKQGRDEKGILCWWLRGGVRIDFLSGERPDLLVGRGYRGGWFEEAARLKPGVWRDNLRPALSDFDGWGIFTTTPLGRNWFWTDIWAKGNAQAAALVAKLGGIELGDVLDLTQFRCVSWTTADNDSIAGLAREMDLARRQMPDALFRRNYLADFDAFEGQCFDLSARAATKWPEGRRFKRIYAGFDSGNVGQTSHRSSFSVVVQDAETSQFYEAVTQSGNDVLPYSDDAWARRDRGDTSTWENRLYHALRGLAKDMWRTVPVFVPADRADIKLVWESRGFKVEEAHQSPGAGEAAVTWIQVALYNDKLKIGSEVLWTCMTGIHYPGPGEHSRKLWMDANDDEFDGFRYALSAVLRDGIAPTFAPQAAMRWKTV